MSGISRQIRLLRLAYRFRTGRGAVRPASGRPVTAWHKRRLAAQWGLAVPHCWEVGCLLAISCVPPLEQAHKNFPPVPQHDR
jgi:hypothetical protein